MIPRKQSKYVKDAIFLSNTSLSDFLSCPKAYYLKNIYRDSRNNYRLQIASPYLSLGATVHDVIKWYLTSEDVPSLEGTEQKFHDLWGKYSGKRGGFIIPSDEEEFIKRGLKILENFVKNAKTHFSELDQLELKIKSNIDTQKSLNELRAYRDKLQAELSDFQIGKIEFNPARVQKITEELERIKAVGLEAEGSLSELSAKLQTLFAQKKLQLELGVEIEMQQQALADIRQRDPAYVGPDGNKRPDERRENKDDIESG